MREPIVVATLAWRELVEVLFAIIDVKVGNTACGVETKDEVVEMKVELVLGMRVG